MATILVCDDKESNREVLSYVLGRAGHDVLEAADGAEALEIMRIEKPHLIITDLAMPIMGGAEFVEQLRADPTIAQTPVIICTADERAIELARAFGVSDVIPFTSKPEDILEVVGSVLAGMPDPVGPMLSRAERLDSVLDVLKTELKARLGGTEP